MDNIPEAKGPAIPLSVVRGMAAAILNSPLNPLALIRLVDRIDAELIASGEDEEGRPRNCIP